MSELYSFTKQELTDAFNRWQEAFNDNEEYIDASKFEGNYGEAATTELLKHLKGEQQ